MSSTGKQKQTIGAYLLSDGKIVTHKELSRYSLSRHVEKSSKQADPQSWYGAQKFVEPPYSPSALLAYMEANSVHSACCRQIASDTVGLGWTLDRREPMGSDGKKGRNKPSEKQREVALAFLEKPNPDPQQSLRQILRSAQTDFESIGWLTVEVGRGDLGGKPKLEIYHVPAHTIRLHRDRWRFRQAWSGTRMADRRWFKLYGREERVDLKTGNVGKAGPPRETDANELIFLNNYTSKSTFYGVPGIVSGLGSIIAMGEVRDYNISFFRNHAVPEFIIVIEGMQGELSDKNKKAIERSLQERFKGAVNEHRTAILAEPRGVKIRFEKLHVDVRDASFRLYRQSCMEDILMAHRMPPYRIGIVKVGALGGTDNRDANEVYKSAVVRPRQLDWEEVINRLLGDLDVKDWVWRLKEIDTVDRAAEIERHKALFDRGAINPNWLRQKLDLGEDYPGGDAYYVNGIPVELAGMMKSADMGRGGSLLGALRSLDIGIRHELERRKRVED